jgi:hypothetical protein
VVDLRRRGGHPGSAAHAFGGAGVKLLTGFGTVGFGFSSAVGRGSPPLRAAPALQLGNGGDRAAKRQR